MGRKSNAMSYMITLDFKLASLRLISHFVIGGVCRTNWASLIVVFDEYFICYHHAKIFRMLER